MQSLLDLLKSQNLEWYNKYYSFIIDRLSKEYFDNLIGTPQKLNIISENNTNQQNKVRTIKNNKFMRFTRIQNNTNQQIEKPLIQIEKILININQQIEVPENKMRTINKLLYFKKMNKQLYALVFICHDLNSILNIKKYLIYSNCYIIFVGNKELLYDNKKIIIARLYDNNIEHEQKLLTFTAWYLIIKNNLFKEYTHICLLEYDVIIKPSFV